MKLSLEEMKLRKEASATRCLDENGNPISDASKSVASHDLAKSCDVNNIVDRVLRRGATLPSLNRAPRFGDFTKAVDFQELSNRVIRMNAEFMALDPLIRLQFDNDPAKLLAFLEDPKNKAESIKLGLRAKPVFTTQKLETPEGVFWLTLEDGVEIKRDKVAASGAA